MIAAHPWAGVGWGEFNFAWSMTPFPDRPVAFFDHTHNLALQFAVELGLPLAGLVLGLLGWGLWRGWADTHRDAAAPNLEQASMLRAAWMMVLMILVHSQLEYPLWYAYFLLPAAFAFGLCLGRPGQPAAWPRAASAPQAQPTRPLMVLAMVLVLVGAAALFDYFRVVVIFAPPTESAPLPQRIADGQRSWFFPHHADYAAVTVIEHPSQAMAGFDRATHYLLDARLMMAWAVALNEVGDTQRARYVAQRLKEFRNEQATAFFAPCAVPAAAGAAAELPFLCMAPTASLTYVELQPRGAGR